MSSQQFHKSINDLLFLPWIGGQYGDNSMFEIPILIVGESNYTDDLEREEPHATFTHRLIEAIICGSWKHNFFSNIQRTFVEEAKPKEVRAQFWHSVAHHEYIQDWLPKPGVPPSEEMWKKGKSIFQEVVTELQPKCILFVCKRVYDEVARDRDFPQSSPSLTFDGGSRETLQIQDARVTYILHPTWNGFRKSRGVVHELIHVSGGKTWV